MLEFLVLVVVYRVRPSFRTWLSCILLLLYQLEVAWTLNKEIES